MEQDAAEVPVDPPAMDTHTLNATSYNAIAERYTSWSLSHQAKIPQSSNPRLNYLNKLHGLLPDATTATVLDLGCGAGVPCTQAMARRCYKGRVVGVDSSSAMIELAKKYVMGQQQPELEKFSGAGKDGIANGAQQDADGSALGLADVELIVANMAELAFPPGSFDAVAAFYSVIHLPRDELKGLLERIAGWLVNTNDQGARQGYLLLNLGVTDNPGAYNREWLASKDGHMFWSSFDAETNLKIVERAGFEIVESAVHEDDEDGRKVPFLWILARKR